MTFHAFFSLSTGISRDIQVPKGTVDSVLEHIEETEGELSLTRKTRDDGRWHWADTKENMLSYAKLHPSKIGDMGQAVLWHNEFVRELYADLGKWAAEPIEGEAETITAEVAQAFWGGLEILDFPKELWDEDYFTDHMQHLYKLLSEGKSRGVSLTCEPFNSQQISALLPILESELDQWGFDIRFEIPLDENLEPYDFLATGEGYDWCGHCGPIHIYDSAHRCRICPRAEAGECELKNDLGWMDED